jgi:hypothetical protein
VEKVDLTRPEGASGGGAGGGARGSLGDIIKGIAKTSGAAGGGETKRAKKPRLLVCAPSNAAVDLLVERLLRDKLRDANGWYTPDMIRVGSPNACSDRIRVVTLDHQVKNLKRELPVTLTCCSNFLNGQ